MRIFRVLGYFVLWLIALIVLLTAGAYAFRNQLLDRVVNGAGSRALGTDVSIGSVSWDVFNGRLVLEDLNIDNPEGFDEKAFLDVKRVELSVRPRALMKRMVHLETLKISGISLYLDKQNDKSNYEFILANLQPESGPMESQSADVDETRLIIDRLIMKDITVSASLLPLGGNVTRCEYKIDEIELKNVGQKDAQGLATHQLFGLTTKALFSSALQIGGKVLPHPIREGLNVALTPVWNLGELGIDVLAYTVGGVVDVAAFMGKGLYRLGRGVGRGLVSMGKAVMPGGDDSTQTAQDSTAVLQ